ncbi:metallophosphoesterase family protein [Halorubrum ezzemoulense]|uniref:metallophosphoesterase family protein n=1 Tax=Halorubrum ezzemoulense TaxID=337243 RepID=UPI002330042D|nr:metallophosphoesterase family protein [Halorubrum ezzemoulense]MDB2236726.1 metallophosphoesterase family protein [Halorubrum ezzemoulense]MDB2247285.1 metallophosphoesterase family protein [Halorubrum ezzemoulense]MDB9248133.1 metallophosphoesterase family protein [Halorubrum ezzemoulense]MDB9257958.1 metallophosphoesterase family protein [Halorubrum ezzemoulense]MDB9261680.1 metallophosphoesterase family protein [Halorubrum ezzemoulense]
MKIGLISDVHANLPALETVLDDMPTVDRIYCAGDVVGYNPWPADCVERVRDVAAATVRGNHDRTVETPERYRANRMAEAGLERAKASLSADQRDWIGALPRTETFGGDRYLLAHSHPAAEREDAYVYPDDFPTLDRHMGEYDGIVLGHTHVQGVRKVAGGFVCNPGSVGQPRDGDPRAGYAVLDTTADGADAVETHRVEYDIDSVAEAVREADLPDLTAERLYEGE